MKKLDESLSKEERSLDHTDSKQDLENQQHDDTTITPEEKPKERKPRVQKKAIVAPEKTIAIQEQSHTEETLKTETLHNIPSSPVNDINQEPLSTSNFTESTSVAEAEKDTSTPTTEKGQESAIEKRHDQKNRPFDRHAKKPPYPQQRPHIKKPISEMNLQELVHYARRSGILGAGLMNKTELIEKINYVEAHPDIEMDVEGVLEKLPDGFGFLRSAQYDYTSSPDDVYVSPSQIRRFSLRNGDIVRGVIRKLREEERYFALLKVTQVNYEDPAALTDRPHFDNLVPVYPHDKFNLEFDPTSSSTRIMDLFTPIGKGQRGLIVAPPKVGKTMLLKELARAIIANHPDTFLIVLHIDERPEEVADMRRTVRGGRAEVISSTFDETAERHVQVAEIALEKAKRLVECGYDVVILLDSITRLARAYNTIAPASGKVLTGGIDANALQRPKRFFGAARCAEKTGSSLTIIASALIETGSRMDEVIFEEFKGTGNMEINMTRKLSNRRVFPAFDLLVSGTRRDDLLLSEETLNKVWVLQKFLGTMNTVEGMEFLIEKIKKTKTNDEFLESMTKQNRTTNGSSTPNS